jgi:LuxR family maltose regulon positive regulatory protein
MKVSQLFTPLLSTKLHIPRRQRLSQQTTLVSRPQLLARLEAGLAGKLTLIAAPAGFGKTTLLCEWIDGTESAPPESAEVDGMKQMHPPTFCWLSLEENDNDPIRFWLYFIAAIHSHYPDLSADLPVLLQSPEPPPLETILIILINDLIAWSEKSTLETTPEIILVLEDYHFIATSAIHQSLAFLLDHLPPVLHLVMTTRADPPLPLARLRARGQLLEIRADDLRFTAEETAIFVNQRMGLDLAPNEAQLLAERTEGWIAGIQLAALSMRGLMDKTGFLHAFSGSHRYILTYLIEEVLNQQPQNVQEFLLRTCILTRLSGPLCDAMIGVGTDGAATMANLSPNVNSQDILEQLEQANLFLVPLDDLGQWYRYHQLFAEVLQYRLRHDQPEILPVLHRRASLWFAEQGYLADAIRHALLATDFAYAAALIEQVWTALWDQGAVATLFGWMQALPEEAPSGEALSGEALSGEALWGQPGLYVSYAWSLALTGQIEAAETTLHQVDLSLQRTGAEAAESPIYKTLLGRTTSLRAMLAARRGNPAVAVSLAQQAITLIPPEAPSRGDAFYTLGLAWQQDGALTDALQAYDTALQLGEAADDHFLAVAARYHEARVFMAQGHLQRAAATYQQILAIATQTRKKLPVVGLAHIGYGEILYQWNDLAAAVREVDTGLGTEPTSRSHLYRRPTPPI